MNLALRAVAVALLAVLAGCSGSPGLEGSFTGSFQGQPVTLELKPDGSGEKLGGSIRWNGQEGEVRGTRSGESASGSVRNHAMGVELAFEAKLAKDGDAVEWTYLIPNQFTGQTERLPLTLARAGAESEGGGQCGGGGAPLDPSLVGRWYTEVGGSLASGNSAMTRIHVTLNGDGTFVNGGSDTLIGLRDYPGGETSTQGVLNGNTTQGRWKAEGGILSYQAAGAAGSAPWVPVGRYQLSGSTDLMLYTPDGQKQLWSRE